MSKVTQSVAIDDLSLDQLLLVSQGLGREIDKLRAQRAYMKAKIDARLDAGERESTPDAVAPGAVIEASAGS